MLVYDIFNQQTTVNSPAELHAILSQRREDGANSYRLSHEGKDYPHLALLVKGKLASVTYFSMDDDAGYVPAGNLAALPIGKLTTFSTFARRRPHVGNAAPYYPSSGRPVLGNMPSHR